VKKNIPTIAKRLQTDFKMSGYTVRLNTTTDKTYSKLEESCNQLIEHYNIINLIINVFTSRKAKEEFEKILFSSEQEILKTIPADIQKKLNNAVTQMFKKVGDFNISFSNFFTVTVKDKMNNLVNNSHSLIGNYSISGASHSITENYSKSLKHMSY
jgi:sugar-specific transcriptional regulator TrmB